jgi:hypothetical protein
LKLRGFSHLLDECWFASKQNLCDNFIDLFENSEYAVAFLLEVVGEERFECVVSNVGVGFEGGLEGGGRRIKRIKNQKLESIESNFSWK